MRFSVFFFCFCFWLSCTHDFSFCFILFFFIYSSMKTITITKPLNWPHGHSAWKKSFFFDQNHSTIINDNLESVFFVLNNGKKIFLLLLLLSSSSLQQNIFVSIINQNKRKIVWTYMCRCHVSKTLNLNMGILLIRPTPIVWKWNLRLTDDP